MFTRERGEEGVRRERNGWGGGEGSQAEEAHVSPPACQARYEWAFTWIQADSEHWLCWIRIQTEGLHMSLQLLLVQHFVFYNVNQISLGFTQVRRKIRLMVTNYKLETFPSFHSHLVWLPVKTKVQFRHLCVFPWFISLLKVWEVHLSRPLCTNHDSVVSPHTSGTALVNLILVLAPWS